MLLQTAPTIQEWGVLLPDLVLLVDEALFHLVWVVILHAAAVLLDALVERGCAAVGVWHYQGRQKSVVLGIRTRKRRSARKPCAGALNGLFRFASI